MCYVRDEDNVIRGICYGLVLGLICWVIVAGVWIAAVN